MYGTCELAGPIVRARLWESGLFGPGRLVR